MKRSAAAVREVIFAEIKTIQKKAGGKAKPLTDKSPLFGSGAGLDSLDLAELIVRLERKLGADPFKAGRTVRTVKELSAYYAKHSKK